MINEINRLIKDAEFEASFNKAEMVKFTLNLELTPDSTWDKLMLNTVTKKVAQAEYRLGRLREKLASLEEKALPDANPVTRLEVIGSAGRLFVDHNLINVELAYQDEGRTLKIFVN